METDDLPPPHPPIPPPKPSPSTNDTSPTPPGTNNGTPLTQGTGNQRQDYLYNDKDTGPFRVYVELKDTDSQADRQKSINKVSVGRMLSRIFGVSKLVTEIKNAGKKKVLVYLSEFSAANRVVQNSIIGTYGYKAYVAKHLVAVTGVIPDIPTDVSEEEIKRDLHSLLPIMDVYRLHRFVNGVKAPSTRVSITFRSQKLPEVVKLYSCSIKVQPFYRKVIICTNCLRYNHRAQNCRSARRCQKCGERHEHGNEYEECTKPNRCVYCKIEHSTTDEKCPERQRQNNIKMLMAKKALTFFEANEHFKVATSNSFNALAEFVDEPTPDAPGTSTWKGNASYRNPFKRQNNGKKKPDSRQPDTRQPDSEESNKRPRKDASNENNGTCLNNPQKVNEQEQWKKKLEDAQKEQGTLSESSVNHAIQQAFMRYYSAIIADNNLKGKARENLIETSKKYLSFDVIHKN